MTSSHAITLAQAKQGDVKAIASWLNSKLQPKGITAKASIKNSCLHIMLESAKVPPQKPLVDSLQKVFSSFSVNDCHEVKVYGRQTGEEIPDWTESFKVGLEQVQNLEVLARQGNIKAITALINQKLQSSKILAKISLKGSCLQIMLESLEVPDQKQMVSLLQTEILKLEVDGITSLKLYGKETGEDFPDWQDEVSLITINETQSQKSQAININPEPSSKELVEDSTLYVAKEIDGVDLSNHLYGAIQTTCYENLVYKVNSEDDKSVHEIVTHFVDGLESDLKLDLDQFAKEVVSITESFGIQVESAKIQSLIADVTSSKFTGIRLAIRELERVTQEVLQTNFPQETNALKAFFTGATQEVAANLLGGTTMSGEAMAGIAIGSFIAPGIGSVIGGAIGGWIGGNKQQKAIEAIIEKYQKARNKLFEEWESLLRVIYTKLKDFLSSTASVNLLTYQSIEQAINLYNEANSYLETEDKLHTTISLYDKAISLNPQFVLAYNMKGCVLIHLERYEEALEALSHAIQIDSTFSDAFNNYAQALYGLDRYEDSLSMYEQSVKLDSESYEAWSGKMGCLALLKRPEQAMECAQKLINLDSENFWGWYGKASFQALLGYKQASLTNLKEAVRLNPDAAQSRAKNTTNFDELREDEQFKALMESSVGVSYANLKKYLKQQQWREADHETARLIREVIQKVADSTEVNQINLNIFPLVDLNTIDTLWKENSDGRFGFSIQKKIYQRCKDRDAFGNKVGWRFKNGDGDYVWYGNDNFNYKFTATGHLPSSLWAGEDGWFENRRDRLAMLFARMESIQDVSPVKNDISPVRNDEIILSTQSKKGKISCPKCKHINSVDCSTDSITCSRCECFINLTARQSEIKFN
jgi:tetratricopeptide (TPR) repeat protein